MLNGHGDDLFRYDNIRINFSSNIYNHFNHEGLFLHLAKCLDKVKNYPEPVPLSLEAAIAKHLSLRPEEVMVTNGCTEAIYLIAQTFRGAHSCILTPTFSEYADACRMHGHKVERLKNERLKDERLRFVSTIKLSSFILKPYSKMFWLCNPNNPTGTVIPKEQLIEDIQANPESIFVIDASYAPYTTKPLLSPQEAVSINNTSPLKGGLGGLFLLHSMTKEYGVPGLRIGYVTANATLLAKVKANRMPWSVSPLAIEAGKYLLKHADEYKIDAHALCTERQRVAEALASTGAVDVFPSDTNILLCKLNPNCILRHVAEPTTSALKEYLALKHGILIRDASNFGGLDDSYFRIAVQSQEENDELIEAIEKL